MQPGGTGRSHASADRAKRQCARGEIAGPAIRPGRGPSGDVQADSRHGTWEAGHAEEDSPPASTDVHHLGSEKKIRVAQCVHECPPVSIASHCEARAPAFHETRRLTALHAPVSCAAMDDRVEQLPGTEGNPPEAGRQHAQSPRQPDERPRPKANDTIMQFEPLLDIDEVAELLATSTRHVKRLVYERRIPYVKVGRWVRFKRSDLAAWVKEQVVEPTARVSRPRRKLAG